MKETSSTTAKEDAPLLREDAVARLLDCSTRTLQFWRCRNSGPDYIKVTAGRRGVIRYRRDAVEDFLLERTVRTARRPCESGLAPEVAHEIEELRRENAMQAAAIEALETENEKLQAMALAWRPSAKMDA